MGIGLNWLTGQGGDTKQQSASSPQVNCLHNIDHGTLRWNFLAPSSRLKHTPVFLFSAFLDLLFDPADGDTFFRNVANSYRPTRNHIPQDITLLNICRCYKRTNIRWKDAID